MPAMPVDEAPSSDASLGGRLAVWVATGLGVGLVTPAPGTIGGLWGIPLTLAVAKLPGLWVQAAVVVALLVIAAYVCGAAARALGAASDPQPVALDEIVVLPIVFLGAPPLTWKIVLAGFLLFRLFDIWKPGMVREAEKLPGGWGVVADDVAAAALAWATLRGVFWLEGAFGVQWFAA
jgi:phosphatidylglycerophosphatase A